MLVYFIVGMAFAHLVLRPAGHIWMLGIVVGLAGAAVFWVAILHINLGFERGDPYRMMIATLVVAAVIWVEPVLRRIRIPKVLMLGGDASYSIYLFHPMVGPIAPALMAVVGLRFGLVSVLSSVAIALIGYLVFVVTERPITGWLRERLPYAGRARTARPSAS